MSKKLSTEEFIKKAKEIHGDKYDYSKVKYTSSREKIIIICKIHGEFLQKASNHLQGKDCRKCKYENSKLTTKVFIQKANKIHNNKYDYSKTNYKLAKEKVIIICPEHGEFSQKAKEHLEGRGCRKCHLKNNKSNTLEFIEKAKKVHGDKYDYSKTNYEKAREKVIIICKKHGEFTQTPDNHLSGKGCNKCTYTSYSKKGFKQLVEKNTGFGHLYIIECYDKNELFYKIGITSKDIDERFGHDRKSILPYDYKIIKEIKNKNSDYIFDLEKKLHELYNKFKYKPNKIFGGETECFNSNIDLSLIEKYLN